MLGYRISEESETFALKRLSYHLNDRYDRKLNVEGSRLSDLGHDLSERLKMEISIGVHCSIDEDVE